MDREEDGKGNGEENDEAYGEGTGRWTKKMKEEGMRSEMRM